MKVCFYVEIVHVGLELASETSRYRKLVVGHPSHAKTYGRWAHRCTGQTFNTIYIAIYCATAVNIGCIYDPVISVRVLLLLHNNSVNYS